MQWLVFAFIMAVLYSVISIIIKKVLKDNDSNYLAMALSISGAIIHIPFLLVLRNYIEFNTTFLWILIPVGIIGGTGRLLVTKALKVGKLSKTVPLLSLSPLFAILFGLLLLNEMPKSAGIIGIFLIAAGTYILDIEKLSKHILAPFKYIFIHVGPRLMFIVAILYGIGINIDKIAVNNSNPITYVLLSIYPLGLMQFVFLFSKDKKGFSKNIKKIFNNRILVWLVIINLLTLSMIFFQVTSLTMSYAAYVSAIKRTSGIFAVIAGFFIFKERKHFWTTLTGAIIMVIGTIFLTL